MTQETDINTLLDLMQQGSQLIQEVQPQNEDDAQHFIEVNTELFGDPSFSVETKAHLVSLTLTWDTTKMSSADLAEIAYGQPLKDEDKPKFVELADGTAFKFGRHEYVKTGPARAQRTGDGEHFDFHQLAPVDLI